MSSNNTKKSLDKNSLRLLASTGRCVRYQKGSLVHTSDLMDTIFMVKSGYVKRYSISNEGMIGVQSIYGPGSIFPLTGLFRILLNQDINASLSETYYYDTMCDTEVYIIDNAKLVKEAVDNPMIFKEVLLIAVGRLESNIQRLENANLRSAPKRVAHQLVFFARRFGKEHIAGTRIEIPLTHQDIADVLNITRETTTRALSQLKSEKLVEIGKYIVIPDIEALESRAIS